MSSDKNNENYLTLSLRYNQLGKSSDLLNGL